MCGNAKCLIARPWISYFSNSILTPRAPHKLSEMRVLCWPCTHQHAQRHHKAPARRLRLRRSRAGATLWLASSDTTTGKSQWSTPDPRAQGLLWQVPYNCAVWPSLSNVSQKCDNYLSARRPPGPAPHFLSALLWFICRLSGMLSEPCVSDYVFLSVFLMHQLVNQFSLWRPKTILAWNSYCSI